MRTQNLIQGSPDWHAYRAQHDNASDAPAMMGVSSYKTRDELIAERAMGITPEVNAATQRRFDSGHRFEALARPLAEAIIGEDLSPVTGSQDDGRLSASFDGLTMLDDVAFEHKRLNERLRAVLSVPGCTGADLPLEYQIQMEQQCAVSGCEKVLFMASAWADDDALIEEMHCWYTPNLELRAKIVAGWEQFHKDLAAYTPPESKAAPVVGRAPEHLPALRIEVTGAVTASNLAEFRATALAAIAGVNRDLATDADFADAEASVKWCAEVESRLAAAKQHALSQTVDVDALFRTMDDIAAEARRVRLELDKMIKQRKEALRGEIVAGGMTALRAHIDTLNQSIGRSYVPMVSADFGGAVKGKRSLDSIQGAVNDELARAKIAANEVATRIQHNLKTLHDTPGIHLVLFPDVAAIVLKERDDFAALVQTRMAQHQAAGAQRLEHARAAAEAQANASAVAAIARAATAPAAPAAPAQQQPDDGERINLGAINEYLQKLKVDAAQLASLGFEPVGTIKASKLYRACDLPAIRAALIAHLVNLPELQAA
ncbi:MAG: YqaJ viral recombinase family protein [Simplicispira sp.]|nr:YqaJ viral recombinase family protein [Simplicispira sp.]